MSILAITVQVIVNHKYLGHFVMVLYYIISAFASSFGFEHRLYRYASTPGYTYSDMNGFGHFIGPIVWFNRYLMGRGTERKKKMPLALVENQAYIHYNKGSLVMYALQDYIGESTVNQALSNYIKDVGFQEPPYTVSRELIEHFRQATPSELESIIEDLFETITLFNNRAVAATYKQIGEGNFEVCLKVASHKYRADELGVENEVPIDDHIDIGVLDKDGNYLYLQKHRLETSESEIIIQVDGRPAKAGIDPLNKLVDRKPKDNVISVRAG